MRYSDDDLVLFFYGEADDPVAIREALAADPELRARYEALERVLAAVDLPVPERPASYGARVWARLRPELERPAQPSSWKLLGGPRLAWAGAAAVLLLAVGFLAGRLWPPREGPAVARALPETARDRILAGEVAGHLESSERLLVELANAEPGEPADLSAERAWAQDLLEANRLYRQSARHGGRKRLAALLDELEPFLLELAHAPDETSPEELEALRGRIEEQALLFKVRILGERLEQSVRTGESKQTL
jgi:hypothetical protein